MTHNSKTRNYEETLNFGASMETIERARDLRKRMTETEKLLWAQLRAKKLAGLKFRRQHPIWIFITDFYCHEVKLVVELDGGIHQESEQKQWDENRTAELERFEIQVIRFTNKEVFENLEVVLKTILNECEKRKE